MVLGLFAVLAFRGYSGLTRRQSEALQLGRILALAGVFLAANPWCRYDRGTDELTGRLALCSYLIVPVVVPILLSVSAPRRWGRRSTLIWAACVVVAFTVVLPR